MEFRYKFLLIGPIIDQIWNAVLLKVLSSYGEITIILEENAEKEVASFGGDFCIIDLSSIYNIVQFLSIVKKINPDLLIVVTGQSANWKKVKHIFQAGATDYIQITYDEKKLRNSIRELIDQKVTSDANYVFTKRKNTILIVDNFPASVIPLSRYIEKNGYKVEIASTREDAKRIVNQGHIDIAVIDMRLSDDGDEKDISGLELAKEIGNSIPKIMFTGYSTIETIKLALMFTEGESPLFIDYVSKDSKADELMETIKKQEVSDLRKVFVELQKVKKNLDLKAVKDTKKLMWTYFGIFFTLSICLAYLTYKVGWVVMEPWTYFIGLGFTLGSYLYFAITLKELSPIAFYKQNIEKNKQKNYCRISFDNKQYEELTTRLKGNM